MTIFRIVVDHPLDTSLGFLAETFASGTDTASVISTTRLYDGEHDLILLHAEGDDVDLIASRCDGSGYVAEYHLLDD